MLTAAPERNITISQYRDNEDSPVVKIFIQGFEPTFAPLVVEKGLPGSMCELVEQLQNLLGVFIKLEPPGPKP